MKLTSEQRKWVRENGGRFVRLFLWRVGFALIGLEAGHFIDQLDGADAATASATSTTDAADAASATESHAPQFGANGEAGRFNTDYLHNGHPLVADQHNNMYDPDHPGVYYSSNDAGVTHI